MRIYQYIFYLGIICLIFGFIWNRYLLIAVTNIFYALGFPNGVFFSEIIRSYLLVSLITLVTIAVLREYRSVLSIIVFYLIGFFIFLVDYENHSYLAYKKSAEKSAQSNAISDTFYMIMFLSKLGLYIITLYLPFIATNTITLWLFQFIGQVIKLHVIGLVLGIIGVIFLAYSIWNGLLINIDFFRSIGTGINKLVKRIN